MFVIRASFFNISRNFFFNMSRYGLYRIFPYNKIMVAAREGGDYSGCCYNYHYCCFLYSLSGGSFATHSRKDVKVFQTKEQRLSDGGVEMQRSIFYSFIIK